MKVLVSTKETQGQGDQDFSFTNDGELVYFGFECANTCSCGCSWAFSGLDSKKGTTTAKVVDRDMTKEEFVALMRKSVSEGWPTLDEKTLDEGSVEEVDLVLKIADQFDDGAIVCRDRKTRSVVERMVPA